MAPVVPRRSVRDCYKEPDQTREPRGPSPSGGKTPASLLSLEHPARLCRAVRGQGVLPLARAVAPVVPRRSVRDCYREPDQTRKPRGPLPSGGKTPASLLSLEHPARLCRAVRGQGVLPLARAVAPVVPRRSVRDCYREPDQTRKPRGPLPSGGISAANWRVSRALPRPMGAVWGAGGHPLLSRRWPAKWCCSRRRPSDRSRRPLPYRSLC